MHSNIMDFQVMKFKIEFSAVNGVLYWEKSVRIYKKNHRKLKNYKFIIGIE